MSTDERYVWAATQRALPLTAGEPSELSWAELKTAYEEEYGERISLKKLKKGVVDVHRRRLVRLTVSNSEAPSRDEALEDAIKNAFSVERAYVYKRESRDGDRHIENVGSQFFRDYVRDQSVFRKRDLIGISSGSAIRALVRAAQMSEPVDIKGIVIKSMNGLQRDRTMSAHQEMLIDSDSLAAQFTEYFHPSNGPSPITELIQKRIALPIDESASENITSARLKYNLPEDPDKDPNVRLPDVIFTGVGAFAPESGNRIFEVAEQYHTALLSNKSNTEQLNSILNDGAFRDVAILISGLRKIVEQKPSFVSEDPEVGDMCNRLFYCRTRILDNFDTEIAKMRQSTLKYFIERVNRQLITATKRYLFEVKNVCIVAPSRLLNAEKAVPIFNILNDNNKNIYPRASGELFQQMTILPRKYLIYIDILKALRKK